MFFNFELYLRLGADFRAIRAEDKKLLNMIEAMVEWTKYTIVRQDSIVQSARVETIFLNNIVWISAAGTM